MHDTLPSIERFWRAANYVTCVLLYLRDNVLLHDDLRPEHVKSNIVGHWGTCPGINAIVAHLYAQIKRYRRKVCLVVGPGHAGPSLAANLFLDGSFAAVSDEYAVNASGLAALARTFGTPQGITTEISPQYPGVQHCGGELGGALAFGQGYALNAPESIVVPILGDGELETALTQSAWQGFRMLSRADGSVLPIINANDYRMGSRSLFSLMRPSTVSTFFRAHNLRCCWARDHASLQKAMASALSDIATSRRQAPFPVIVFQNPKGWTAPPRLAGKEYVNTYRAHKPLLRNPSRSPAELQEVAEWLASYHPHTLFDDDGSLRPEVTEILPPARYRFGATTAARPRHPAKAVPCDDASIPACIASAETPADALSARLSYLMRQDEYRDVLVFSPDELTSNRFGKLLETTVLRYSRHRRDVEPPFSPTGRVIEVLNEQLCFAWLQGLCASGRRGVFVTYEAFAAMCDSEAAQLLKYLGSSTIPQPSVNVIVTSLGWENTPSHHSSLFVDSVLGRNLGIVRVYTPLFPCDAAWMLDDCLSSEGRLNILVAGKHRCPRLSSLAYRPPDRSPWKVLRAGSTACPAMVAIGNGMAEQCLRASDVLSRAGKTVAVYGVTELTFLERPMSDEHRAFVSAVEEHRFVIWDYWGYPRSIEGLLWNVGSPEKHTVLGYRDRGGCPGQDRYDVNAAGSDAICYHLERHMPE